MRFLIIPEDFRKDAFVVEPIVTAALKAVGFANPKARVCRDPLMGGVTEALKEDRLRDVVDRHKGMVDVFLLCVDRDGQTGRAKQLERLEKAFKPDHALIATMACEELETWILAGLDDPLSSPWAVVRSAHDVKERYFEPLADRLNLRAEPGGGRRTLGRQAARNIGRIRQLCPDFDELCTRLTALRS